MPAPQPHTRRRTLLAGAALLARGGAPGGASAQGLMRQARLLCGFPPGASVDAVARLAAEGLRGRHAAAVLVENRTGVGGRLAVEAARGADPDGATLLVTPAGHLTILPHVYGAARLRYAPEDFVPVSPLARFPFGFVTGAAVPAEARTSLGGFVAWARTQPAEVPVGIPTMGSTPHFLALEFARAAGVRLQVAPYRGSATALADVIGGRLPLYVAPLPSSLPLHQAGQVVVFAVTAERRTGSLPGVSTFAEAGGFPPTLALEEWHGLFAPARTPAATVAALNAAVAETLALPATREGMGRLELTPFHEGAEAFAARVRAEYEGWGPVVAASGFRPED